MEISHGVPFRKENKSTNRTQANMEPIEEDGLDCGVLSLELLRAVQAKPWPVPGHPGPEGPVEKGNTIADIGSTPWRQTDPLPPTPKICQMRSNT